MNNPDSVHDTTNNATPGDSGSSFSPSNLECISCHVGAGVHHSNTGGDDSTGPDITVWVAGTGADSYRFLTGGIQGGEKGNWEWQSGTLDEDNHNIYSANTSYTSDGAGISALCNNCHGDFHGLGTDASGSPGVSPWVRHPTDIKLADGGAAYILYGTYDVTVPIAISTANAPTNPIDISGDGLNIYATGELEYVVCLSCHRAHGSPQADMLRWTYAEILADSATSSGAGKGCLKCHTDK